LEKICSVQKKIKQVKDEYEFYDPEYERSVMFPNGEDEEEDDIAF
jgi:putative transducer protein